jgi:hypothetical protein
MGARMKPRVELLAVRDGWRWTLTDVVGTTQGREPTYEQAAEQARAHMASIPVCDTSVEWWTCRYCCRPTRDGEHRLCPDCRRGVYGRFASLGV